LFIRFFLLPISGALYESRVGLLSMPIKKEKKEKKERTKEKKEKRERNTHRVSNLRLDLLY